MSDSIHTLPINNSEIFHENEASKIRPYMNSVSEDAQNFISSNKKIWITGAIFLLLSLPFINGLFKGISENGYIIALLKTVIFIIATFIVQKMI